MIGYCTNVHAGADLQQVKANLERYACAVKRIVRPAAPMGVGLWLSAAAARQIVEEDGVAAFGDWLGERGLAPFTLNGFPYGHFHQATVKYDVYAPNWCDPRRLEFTRCLARILAGLIPDGAEAGISTLPVGWKPDVAADDAQQRAAENLIAIATELETLESETGRRLHVDLEPEPGCLLETSGNVVRFFERHIDRHPKADALHRRLRVCHDVCHAAVMFEEQADVVGRYARAGIAVGKVQVSSALAVDFAAMNDEQASAATEQLRGFAEDRYLHQTTIRHRPASPVEFFDDLRPALDAAPARPTGEWRVHFHVPIDLDRIAALGTTSGEIGQLMRSPLASRVPAFEIETYAWEVLPAALRTDDLAAGIAREWQWFEQLVDNLR
jgi:hypothetical protein